MPARTGQEYIQRLRKRHPEVYLRGERIEDVTTHPSLRRGVATMAKLYDMQHDSDLRDDMTYESPSSGERVGASFIVPRSLSDLEHRRRMMSRWAQASFGMMGRTPDFLNVSLMAMAQAGDYFAQNRPEFKDNIQNYYEYVRENDLALTHTLVNLQRTRSSTSSPLVDTTNVALAVTEETDAASAEEQVRLFRLAWDTCCSAFGTRQVLYERFFQGDAQRNAIILNNLTDTTPMTEMVEEFLEQG